MRSTKLLVHIGKTFISISMSTSQLILVLCTFMFPINCALVIVVKPIKFETRSKEDRYIFANSYLLGFIAVPITWTEGESFILYVHDIEI